LEAAVQAKVAAAREFALEVERALDDSGLAPKPKAILYARTLIALETLLRAHEAAEASSMELALAELHNIQAGIGQDKK